MGYGVQGATQAFLVGIVLVIVFEKTGNIWYSIVIHLGINLFSNVSNALVHSGVSFFTDVNGYVMLSDENERKKSGEISPTFKREKG